MTSDELIEFGVCDDFDDVFRMFPLEMLSDFNPSRRAREPSRADTFGRTPQFDLTGPVNERRGASRHGLAD